MMHRIQGIVLSGLLLLLVACSAVPEAVLVEAEHFDEPGGWTADAQFIDQMGSAYLMAHGLGTPVADASTMVTFPSEGTYYAWVRTCNWNAPWDASQAPGVFQLLADGQVVAERLGDAPESWGWQQAGQFEAGSRPVRIGLRDLTGFNGRCDALYFSKNPRPELPDNGDRLDALRRRLLGTKVTEDSTDYDLVIVGGGTAGMSAAVAASRLGLKTLLLQNRSVLGGNSSPEIAVTITGGIKLPPYEKLGTVVAELGLPSANQQRVTGILDAEENLTVQLGKHVSGVEKKEGRITAVVARDLESGNECRYRGRYFADCTGDANLGYLAGAAYMTGRETRSEFGEDLAPEIPSRLSLGSTMKWHASKTDAGVSFPECPWAVQFSNATAQRVTGHRWYWETGFYRDQIADAERIRDYWLRVIFGNWAWLKNAPQTRQEYAAAKLDYVSYVLGKRESRRLKGDYILTQKDIEGGWRTLPDTAVVCTYTIDQHFPDPENSAFFPGEEFLSVQKHNHNPLGPVEEKIPGRNINEPFMIPYRCLYSADVPNLFMAGRDISVSRIALTAVRIQATTAMMGEAVGIAAALCREKGCDPRTIYTDHLDALKEALGRGVPARYEPVLKITIR